MKEKIERFSKGDFEYELPFICLSEEEISITVEAGKILKDSFIISNSAGKRMKGVVYSSHKLLQVENPRFDDTENTVYYQFNAAYLKEGDRITGELNIVCDCGEKVLPFLVQAEGSYCMTSLGKIKDLFQFTNLARMDWPEAKKVFRSEDFERIFLSNEDRYRFVYNNLIKSISTSQALEEFLITIHKKPVIRLEIDKEKAEYLVNRELITDKLVLTKNHWGFAEIRVSTDASFIQLDQKFLWSDRFIGNTHMVSYSIDPKSLKPGNNFGCIYIKTSQQTIAVEIVCKYKKEDGKTSELRQLQKLDYGLVHNYLNLCLNKISHGEYLAQAETLLRRMPGPEINRFRELMRIHLSIAAGKNKIAEELIGDMAADELSLKRKSVLEYCTYLYLDALYHKDEDTIKFAVASIRRYYDTGYNDWRLLWLLLNVDKQYEKNKDVKLGDIQEQFNAGCHSPILYYEAMCIYNEEPFLLRELGDFEIQILNFGIKNWMISRETAQQYTYLAVKLKSFHPVVFHGLERLYKEYGTKELLSAICSILIKGMKKEEKYFHWYRLGVESQLRITELYEYYMYSIRDDVKELLAQPVLLYFIYNSSLTEKKKAFLYANIIRNKDKCETIYRTYYKKMEVFTAKMLERHYINRDLAVLYREFMGKGMSTEEAGHMPYVLYRHELVCNNPDIVNAVVVHKEFGPEESIPLVDGMAQADIYTENVEIFLVDSFGNRYVESVEYTLTPYLKSEEFESCLLEHSDHPMLLLHLFDRYQRYLILTDTAINIRKKVFQMEGLAKEYVNSCCETLIDYYYDNYDDEQLEYYLSKVDLFQVRPSQRAKFLEFMVIRTFYNEVLEALQSFGMEGIPINRLVKLCSGWLQTPDAGKNNEYMVLLCHYVFIHNKYDVAILQYLLRYYNGSTRDMFKLWQAAKSFELDAHLLEERLLTQMLFAESYIEDSFLVFDTYYKDITNHMLVRAFLTFYAYKFLIHDQVIDEKLFPVMKRELNYEENDVCLLAWLKHNAANPALTQQELTFTEYHITRFVRKGIIMPFFQEYRYRVALPDRIIDKYYITYHCDPRKQVYIHYRLLKNDDTEFATERMPNIYMGIHLKEYILFYHEALQYYITEEAQEDTNITESLHIQYESITLEADESNYNQINLMLMAQEMKDDSTLLDLMENYIKKEYMIDACFSIIE